MINNDNFVLGLRVDKVDKNGFVSLSIDYFGKQFKQGMSAGPIVECEYCKANNVVYLKSFFEKKDDDLVKVYKVECPNALRP